MGVAPRSMSVSANTLAWSRERVTTMRFPKSGFDSNQLSLSRSETTSPTTMMAGGPSFASCTFGTISFSVPVTTLWSVRVPHWMRATGVSALLPLVTRLFTMFWRFFIPMKNTSVPIPSPALSSAAWTRASWGPRVR